MKSAEELLDAIMEKLKERPGLYVGKKSLPDILTFMSGYSCCLEDQGLKELPVGGPDWCFYDYVRSHYGLQDNHHLPAWHWSEIIQFFSGTEESAVDAYFELYDEYQDFVANGGEMVRTADGCNWEIVKDPNDEEEE